VKLLTLSQLRFLRFTPWSTLTVLLGITLGISSIVAVHQISQRVVASLDDVTPPYLRTISHFLEKPALTMSDYFELRASWRAGEVPALKQLMPLVEGTFQTESRSLRIVGLDGLSGVPEAVGLAVLPVGHVVTGTAVGYAAGDLIHVNNLTLTVAFTHSAVPGGMLLTDTGTAQAALGLADEALTRIAVLVEMPGQTLIDWSDRLLPGFSAGVPLPDWTLHGWQVRTLESDIPSLSFARSVLFNLGALGSLALVVAWLLVYQVGVIWLRRRQPSFERLRQMGVSDRELRFGFLLSLCGTGLLAGLAGLWTGDRLAALLAQSVTGYAADESLFIPIVDRWVVLKALGSALAVSFLGGWLAYARESGPVRPPVVRWLIPLALTVVASTAVFAGESLLAGFVAIAAAGLIVLFSISPVLLWLQKTSRHVGGPLLARVGLRELVWYPRDLAVAVGALALALATSIAIALMVDSFRQDFETMLDRRMVHDVFVVGGDRDLGGLAQVLRSREDVETVQAYGRTDTIVAGLRSELGYSRFDEVESARYGLDRPLEEGECVISERLARAARLNVGDRVVVEGRALLVAGIFAGFGDPEPRLLVDEGTLAGMGVALRYDRLSVVSQAPETLVKDIQSLDPALGVSQRGMLRATALEIFDQTFAITQALTFVALIVASVGLYNALLALQLLQQRARELLHAMGVSVGELKSIERWRVVGVGSAAILFALPLGLVMGWMLCRVINPRAFGWSLNLLVQWSSLIWPVFSAIGVMVLVALIPTPTEGALDEG